MDRDRLAGWVASLGDHPHAPILCDLLAEYDLLAGRVEHLAQTVQSHAEARMTAEAGHAVAQVDANRLAHWIITHPTGGDPAEVLALHDRVAG